MLAITLMTLLAGEACAVPSACRQVGTVVTTAPGGKSATYPVNAVKPWIIQGNLLMHPGESVIVRLVEVDGRLIPTAPRQGDKPGDGEIRFSFESTKPSDTILTVESRWRDPLDYMAVMNVDGSGQRTSVCTLMPNLSNFEHWPHGMYEIAIANFTKTKESRCA